MDFKESESVSAFDCWIGLPAGDATFYDWALRPAPGSEDATEEDAALRNLGLKSWRNIAFEAQTTPPFSYYVADFVIKV